ARFAERAQRIAGGVLGGGFLRFALGQFVGRGLGGDLRLADGGQKAAALGGDSFRHALKRFEFRFGGGVALLDLGDALGRAALPLLPVRTFARDVLALALAG